MMELLLGADPEVFVRHNGVTVSGFNMIPGTKKKPHPVDFGAVQVDGMALEFNIEPAHDLGEFRFNIAQVLEALSRMIPEGL